MFPPRARRRAARVDSMRLRRSDRDRERIQKKKVSLIAAGLESWKLEVSRVPFVAGHSRYRCSSSGCSVESDRRKCFARDPAHRAAHAPEQPAIIYTATCGYKRTKLDPRPLRQRLRRTKPRLRRHNLAATTQHPRPQHAQHVPRCWPRPRPATKHLRSGKMFLALMFAGISFELIHSSNPARFRLNVRTCIGVGFLEHCLTQAMAPSSAPSSKSGSSSNGSLEHLLHRALPSTSNDSMSTAFLEQ